MFLAVTDMPDQDREMGDAVTKLKQNLIKISSQHRSKEDR